MAYAFTVYSMSSRFYFIINKSIGLLALVYCLYQRCIGLIRLVVRVD